MPNNIDTNTATYTVAHIAALLQKNDKAVERGILAIYAKQTSDEKSEGTTKYNNNVGFCGWSTKSGSYYARWLLSGKSLSGKHLDKARKICLHHVGQITKIANKQM